MFHCSTSTPFSPPLLLRRRPHHHHLLHRSAPVRRPPSGAVAVVAALSDPVVLEIAEKLEDSVASSPSPPPPLRRLRDASSRSLLSRRWPSRKDEPFRFTDLSLLRNTELLPVTDPSESFLPQPSDVDSPSPHLLSVVDGRFAPGLSRLGSLPSGVFAGNLFDVPPDGHAQDRISAALSDSFVDGDLFWDLNGVGAPDVAVVFVPAGVRLVDEPLHLRFWYSEGVDVGAGRLPVSSPRVLVVVEEGANVAIVEEHLGAAGAEERCYWTNSAMEIRVGEVAKVSHTYLQQQSVNAAHIKWTLVQQEASSTYELIEISTGGKLSRHNLHIQQLGSETTTELSTFHVSQSNQIQDLHSKLILDHPRGYSRQLHKSIVSHSSGHAIFDGNIRVNRFAQQTDAGQLTRTLLLAPRATANVKPNLQIVADDVKCSHGAAISDLEEEQLFYFQTRGINLKTAREALVFSFGAEVISRIPFEPIKKSVAEQLKELLASPREDQIIAE